MLTRSVVSGNEVAVADVHCSHGPGGWTEAECADRDALIVVVRGTFRRRVDGSSEVLDPNLAYFQQAGQPAQFKHTVAGGDRCLSIGVPSGTTTHGLPTRSFPLSASAEAITSAVAAFSAAGHVADLEEVVSTLVAGSLRAAVEASRRARPIPSRERLVADAREALACRPRTALAPLARSLGCSPDHLTRAFRDCTGHSFTAYRRRLRVRCALERIAEGDSDLARVASEAGFADHPHLTRSIRRELGLTPTQVRERLARGDRSALSRPIPPSRAGSAC